MSKIKKILLTLLLILVTAASVIYVWQRENITALLNGLTSSSEELAVKVDDHRNKVKLEVGKYVAEPIEDVSAEDEEKLLKGEITVEEIADKYNFPLEYLRDSEIKEQKKQDDVKVISADPESNVSMQPDSKAVDRAISDGVSKMYALKAKYVNKLGELEREVIKEYTSLPEEQQNEDGKHKILMDKLNYVGNLEKNCDTEVEKVLANLKLELKEYNSDTDIIQILKDAYKQEKEIKKSYYLSIYNN